MLTFSATGYRNPYDPLEKTGYQLITADSSGNEINVADGLSLSVPDPTNFATASVSLSDSSVGTLNSYTINLALSVPVEHACKITIGVPADFDFADISDARTYNNVLGQQDSSTSTITFDGADSTTLCSPSATSTATPFQVITIT